jgi:hypothetical protein
MATKKSVTTVREELRVLNDSVNDVTPAADDTNSWLTPEFWTMAAGAVSNLVMVAVMIGWINTSDAETITKALTALLGATQVVVLNSALIWKYISGRTQIRAKMIDARFRYMEAIAVEKLRADGSF